MAAFQYKSSVNFNSKYHGSYLYMRGAQTNCYSYDLNNQNYHNNSTDIDAPVNFQDWLMEGMYCFVSFSVWFDC